MSHPFAISSHLDVLVRVAGDEICFFPACCKLLLIFFFPPHRFSQSLMALLILEK